MSKYTRLLQSFTHLSAFTTPQYWADLGCGSGVFTEALANLLPAQSRIVGVDRAHHTLKIEMGNRVNITFQKADFVSDDLSFITVDGILIANALHFVKDKENLIKKLEKNFKIVSRFIIVEYEQYTANPWVPYPITFSELKNLFHNWVIRILQKWAN